MLFLLNLVHDAFDGASWPLDVGGRSILGSIGRLRVRRDAGGRHGGGTLLSHGGAPLEALIGKLLIFADRIHYK